MKELVPHQLKSLAEELPVPLYVVGGSVRDFLAGHALGDGLSLDWDICAPALPEALIPAAERCGFSVCAVYRNTGAVKLAAEDGLSAEFTSFRSDEYVRGMHRPSSVFFTDDIGKDARRRDFCCNAVYYDICAERFVDPLGGIEDIREKRIRTVRESRKVFSEDGLRLLRLARFSGQLGFVPDGETLAGARENAALIRDIVPERVFCELDMILRADEKNGIADGQYRALKVLDGIRVLDEILPELTVGRGMAQLSNFHGYDVLEHSLRCALYAPSGLRWAALLHDVGKPACMLQGGSFHSHETEGADISDSILSRLKAPKSLKERTRRLVLLHMYDMQCNVRERKLRRFFVDNHDILHDLMDLKQADYSACKDSLELAPTVARWRSVLSKMEGEGAPLTLRQLAVSGKELSESGTPSAYIGKVLHRLLLLCVCDPQENTRERLLRLADGAYRTELEEENRAKKES